MGMRWYVAVGKQMRFSFADEKSALHFYNGMPPAKKKLAQPPKEMSMEEAYSDPRPKSKPKKRKTK